MTAIIGNHTTTQGTVVVSQNKALANGSLEGFGRVLEKSKGATDVLGAVMRSCKFAQQVNDQTPFMSAAVVDWTKQVQGATSTARNVMAIPALPGVLNQAIVDTTVRNSANAAAVGCFALEVLSTSSAFSKQLLSAGTVLKTGVDAIDCYASYQQWEALSTIKAGKNLTDEMDRLLGDQLSIFAYRVAKFALAAIAGVGAILTMVCGMALSAPVALAFLVAGLGSAILSLKAEFDAESAPYAIKMQLV